MLLIGMPLTGTCPGSFGKPAATGAPLDQGFHIGSQEVNSKASSFLEGSLRLSGNGAR